MYRILIERGILEAYVMVPPVFVKDGAWGTSKERTFTHVVSAPPCLNDHAIYQGLTKNIFPVFVSEETNGVISLSVWEIFGDFDISYLQKCVDSSKWNPFKIIFLHFNLLVQTNGRFIRSC